MSVVFEGKMNVFEAPVKTVTCTVNLVGVMGAGVALQYKKLFPEAFVSYKRACKLGNFKTGTLLLQHLNNGQFGLCFPTKIDWRNNSQLEWIEAGLIKLLATYKRYNLESLSITPLGCGNGNLNYQKDVRPIMLKYLNQMEIPVHICL